MKKFLIILLLLSTLPISVAAEIKVVDGDSLEIGERRIRLDGIDAPEFMQMCRTQNNEEYACGQKALEFAENFLKSGNPECHCLLQKDKYKRELCECFVNGESLNKALVAAGWAVAYREPAYLAAQDEAEEHKRGLWQGKFMRPALYRILNRYVKENPPAISKKGREESQP
ncbi:MAG: thermonuclease family protein [Alphaproteobacteria bacterium]|nr:thermonuclease family protein [Alphaproteobacteria bacterium]